jgi:hypothetical protein
MTDLVALFKGRHYAEVISAVDAMAEPSIAHIMLRAESRFMLGDYRHALPDFMAVLRAKSTGMPFRVFQRARTAVEQSGMESKAVREFWNAASDDPSRRMGEIAKRLLAGDSVGLVADFRVSIEELFASEATVEAWVEAFDLLVAGLSGASQSEFHLATIRKKVIVSGMGWSGSGAIYDYLREFFQIHAIKGESSAIEGVGGFRAFIAASGNRDTCISQAVRFFFRNMLGYYPMWYSSCFKELDWARRTAHDADFGLAYAKGAGDVVRAMLQLVAAAGGPAEHVDYALVALCDTIVERAIAHTAPSDKDLLLDNCIHIQNVSLARYLSNTLVTCCFRDPRTNFVALKREFAGFSKSAEQYVRDSGALRRKFEIECSEELQMTMMRNGSRVEVVGFEDFVVSEAYRRRIAELAGLDPQHRDAYSHFKPWESFRNTQLHLDYEHSEDIAVIQQELPAYCVEFTTCQR